MGTVCVAESCYGVQHSSLKGHIGLLNRRFSYNVPRCLISQLVANDTAVKKSENSCYRVLLWPSEITSKLTQRMGMVMPPSDGMSCKGSRKVVASATGKSKCHWPGSFGVVATQSAKILCPVLADYAKPPSARKT